MVVVVVVAATAFARVFSFGFWLSESLVYNFVKCLLPEILLNILKVALIVKIYSQKKILTKYVWASFFIKMRLKYL